MVVLPVPPFPLATDIINLTSTSPSHAAAHTKMGSNIGGTGFSQLACFKLCYSLTNLTGYTGINLNIGCRQDPERIRSHISGNYCFSTFACYSLAGLDTSPS